NYKDDILSAIKLMLEKNIGRLLVINDEGKPVGLITRTDILRKISSLELLS
ncbi:MAG TPA: CBS domain-containing protein, partial [Acidilobales archaeon]|nr:CBS domain-containing protein [Acidilobales archaeon]